MVDDLKKQMRSFKNLIGFKGKVDVTSRDSMKKLIEAIDSQYKKDVQNSIRLHQLQFYHDLAENQHKKREEDSLAHLRDSSKSSGQKAKRPAKGSGSKPKEEPEPDEVVKIKAKDIDDWKNNMTLSKMYYVMEHPRSEGLTWKRRISKKKKINKFGDKDLVEWRASQNFRLRDLEEWAQRRSVASTFSDSDDTDSDDIDEDSREMEALFQMLDPFDRKKSKMQDHKKEAIKKLPSDRPFVFDGERLEDWTESYSEDSEYSYDGDFSAEKDLLDEEETEISDSEEQKMSPAFDKEDVSELLATHPEFSKYKKPIFRQMDEAKTFEEWLKLYQIAVSQHEEHRAKEEAVDSERKIDRILEEVEPEEDEEAFGQKDDKGLQKEEKEEEKLVEKKTSELKMTHAEEKDDEELLEKEDKSDEKITGEKMSEEDNANLEETNEGKEEGGSVEYVVNVNENGEAGSTPFEESINSQNRDIEKETAENDDETEVSPSYEAD